MGGSTSSTLVGTSDDQLSDLKCMNCHELLTVLPITWYINRGNLCGRCPEMQYNDGYRNKALEALVKLQIAPCRYKKNNCSATMSHENVKKHEETCYYRQYSCPTFPLQCIWKGKRSEIKDHYKEQHDESLIKEDFLTYDLQSNFEQNILVETMCKQFLVQMRFESKLRILRCGLIYFEEPTENKQYVFTVILKNGFSELKRKIFNSRFIDTYLIAANELHEINLNEINLVIQDARLLLFKIIIEEEPK